MLLLYGETAEKILENYFTHHAEVRKVLRGRVVKYAVTLRGVCRSMQGLDFYLLKM